MLTIVFGADTFRSRQKLRSIIEEYRKKQGLAAAVDRVDCEEITPADFKILCEGRSLFSEARLVVAEYFFRDAVFFDEIRPLCENAAAADDIELVLWERELDKNKKKKLEKISRHARLEEFGEMSPSMRTKFIAEEAKKREIRLGAREFAMLADCKETWSITNALEKIKNDESRSPVAADTTLSVYGLGDLFFLKNKKNTTRFLLDLLRQGEDGFGIFSYIVNHARSLFLIKAFAERREPVPAVFGLHPYVIQKTAGLVRGLQFETLVRAHAVFFEKDAAVKTGVLLPEDALLEFILHAHLQTKTAGI